MCIRLDTDMNVFAFVLYCNGYLIMSIANNLIIESFKTIIINISNVLYTLYIIELAIYFMHRKIILFKNILCIT